MTLSETRNSFYDRLSELYRLGCIGGVLGWDQRVYMPPAAARGRADQLQYMALTMHRKATDPEFCRAVDELYEARDSLSPEDQVNVRETKRELDIRRKLPEDFVAEMSEVCSLGYSAWVKARPANDFKAVQPYLEKIVELSRRKCDLLGYEQHPYDALLDLYEPGSKRSVVAPLLLGLAEDLKGLLPHIAEKFYGKEDLRGHYPQDVQYRLFRRVAQDMGFSFESGRLDTTAHPFMTSLGPADVRITTRYDETDFLSGLYGAIHETGHALYDLGLPREHVGTPCGEPASPSIHESQSRFWENVVGRSREFCTYLGRTVREFFPEDAARLTPDRLWTCANRVQPSLIRVEADEVTYSQHIVIRMLLEEALMAGELSVAELPGAWSDLYEKYLGIRPVDYKDGVMQDVHWHAGSIGYFPTYALGNLYNAMMLQTARAAVPDLPQQIEDGRFADLLAWLRENVHRHGMRYRGPELIRNITGKDLSAGPFVDYLNGKFL